MILIAREMDEENWIEDFENLHFVDTLGRMVDIDIDTFWAQDDENFGGQKKS